MVVVDLGTGKKIKFIEDETCCFTGHRPEKFPFGNDESDPQCQSIKAALQEHIIKLNKQGVDRFITGMSRGVDMWAAEAVLQLNEMFVVEPHPYSLKSNFQGAETHPYGISRMEIYGAIPFPGQAESWQKEDQERYIRLVKAMDGCFQIKDKYTKDCYFERNRMMVRSSGNLLAVYRDGESGRSGTGYTVEYARAMKRFVVLIDPATCKATVSHKEDVVWHGI